MKVTIFNGSPKGKQSNTDVLVQAFLEGAAKAGAQTDSVYLAQKEIAHCKGCFACWHQTPGSCVQKDDMAALLEAYTHSDIVGFASPVYTWNMTAMLKNFVDRLIPLKSPVPAQKDGKYDMEDTIPKIQKFVVISNAGFPGEHNFHTVRQVFAPCQPVVEIYRNCGMILRRQDEPLRSKVEAYLETVREAGFELVSTGAVSEELKGALDGELLSPLEYMKAIGMG